MFIICCESSRQQHLRRHLRIFIYLCIHIFLCYLLVMARSLNKVLITFTDSVIEYYHHRLQQWLRDMQM